MSKNNLIFGDMVKTVLEWFSASGLEGLRDTFKYMQKEELISFHHSLGRTIRNHFQLWENKWTPELVDGIDESPLHPDAISMRVIEAVWTKMQHEDHDAK